MTVRHYGIGNNRFNQPKVSKKSNILVTQGKNDQVSQLPWKWKIAKAGP